MTKRFSRDFYTHKLLHRLPFIQQPCSWPWPLTPASSGCSKDATKVLLIHTKFVCSDSFIISMNNRQWDQVFPLLCGQQACRCFAPFLAHMFIRSERCFIIYIISAVQITKPLIWSWFTPLSTHVKFSTAITQCDYGSLWLYINHMGPTHTERSCSELVWSERRLKWISQGCRDLLPHVTLQSNGLSGTLPVTTVFISVVSLVMGHHNILYIILYVCHKHGYGCTLLDQSNIKGKP